MWNFGIPYKLKHYIDVIAQPGQKVAEGEAILILEAMKMEMTVAAPSDGTVHEIVETGQTPAEELLKKYRGEWGGNLAPIYDEYSY